MSKSANAEQLLAIQHRGGVLLRAGAGSGKTFVLVEHIEYLTKIWIEEFKARPNGSFEDYIRTKFSQVVMMTFTKKAAGEMSIRLTEKFVEKSEAPGEDQFFWKTSNELLPMLMVTTIDGFCRKLISSGYFPHLSTEAKIIFDTERTNQVRALVEEWFTNNSHEIDQSILDILIKEKKDLLSSFTHVFSDPGLRLAWKKFELAEINPRTSDVLLAQSFDLNDLENALGSVYQLELDEEANRSAFEKVVATFQSSGLPVVDSVEKLKIYTGLFESIKRLDGEKTARKKSPASDSAREGLARIRDWVVKWKEAVFDYEKHFETKVLPWMNLCLKIFTYIENRLDPNQGMTFGDIEYQVSLALENSSDRERIQKIFQYFIVDEFQDTSDIQFKIIQGLIGSDYKKLFCVGDAKQAIYGFRGGELSVFRNCAELIPTLRSLANNYRSLPEIIEFNNSLFRSILPMGYNFEGRDPFTVNPEDQHVPDETLKNESGSIEIYTSVLQRDLESEGRFGNEDINRLEAIVIADAIQKERANTKNVSTVLYSKLRPSGELIRALMERKIGFTAQFKIDLMDDPVLGIFVCLLKRKFDSNPDTKDRFPIFLFKSYLSVLEVSGEITEDDLKEFDLNVKFWGLIEAFRKFLHKLHITNENSDINLETIETIAELYHQDPETIMNQLLRGDNKRLSLDLRSGDESHMVQIMSAHGSKGLEFDVVFLAGIYTNGREQHDSALFGDLPGSFNWFIDITQREKRKSPRSIYEAELSRFKNYSESKRLFYVACTRAKKKLIWVDFEIPEKTFSIPKNSWILGLRAWLASGISDEKVRELPLEGLDSQILLSSQSLPQLPLFFHDPVGIFHKGEGQTELMIAAELSVTRLNTLLDCPRKFYLSNILKISEPKDFNKLIFETEDDELTSFIRSNTDRGTHIHAQIAKGIQRNFIVPRESFGTEFQGPVGWVLDILKTKTVDYELVAERPLKFKFFNFMISGTPDLILFPKGDKLPQVWDFKTGRMSQDSLKHYWLQLSTYAYALYELGKIPKSVDVELVLCFVDRKEFLVEKVSLSSCERDLYPLWHSQNGPWKVNLDHCSQCSYGSICPR